MFVRKRGRRAIESLSASDDPFTSNQTVSRRGWMNVALCAVGRLWSSVCESRELCCSSEPRRRTLQMSGATPPPPLSSPPGLHSQQAAVVSERREGGGDEREKSKKREKD